MISVIIPVFNVEKYLHVCLNSVLNQDYQNFEIICVEDCSTDSSMEILEYFAQKDSRIKIIKNEQNMGPGFSRNIGLNEADGDYILFLDGDDWFSPNAFEYFVKQSENDELDVLIFKNIVYYDEQKDFGMEPYYDMSFLEEFDNKVFNHYDLDKSRLFSIPNVAWNKFYRKSFLDENNIRFPNENLIHEDNPFYCKVITSAKRISFIDKYLYNRRRRLDSIMTLNNERLFDNIDVMYNVLDVFFEDKQLYDYYKNEVLTCIFSTVFKNKYDQIDDELKEDFFKAVQEAYKVYIKKYGLYKDIKENVNKEVLEFFKFDEIVADVLSPAPKISVIIPVYNVEKYLSECLDSVLNQTFDDLEIICVNDGSTDNSLSILKEYQNRDSRIKILTQENKGLSSARNAGLNQARGEYVYFIDSNDYIENTALAELYELSESKELDMNIFKIISFRDDSKEKFTIPYFEMEFLKDIVGEDVFSFKDLGSRMYNLAVTVYGVLFKRDLISDLRFPEGLIFEDNVFFTEAVFKAKRIYFYDKYLYNRRVRNGPITSFGSNFSDTIEITNMVIDLAKKYNNFDSCLYSKKLYCVRKRFLQVSEENKEEFFRKIQKDFFEHQEEYESSQDFNNLPDAQKSTFYAGLNAKNYKEFEDMIIG